MASNDNLLTDMVVFLVSAVIMVPFSRFLGLGSVLGYLVAGMAIGPWGLKFITSAEEVLHFSEFGVVLLLFLIGLELNPRRLWEMRKPIFGLGGAQVFISTFILSGLALALGVDQTTAWVAGFGLSLSSTAIVLQVLSEKSLLKSPIGQSSFAILLFQDLSVVPFLTVIPLLGAATQVATVEEGAAWYINVGKMVSVLAGLIIGGRFFIGPVFGWIARSGVREVFTAFSLLLVCGIAWLMSQVNLSMALGTFLAGVLLAESEYRHELESNIEPFKGLLLGLFFISVGMSLDFGVLAKSWHVVLALVFTVLFVKGLVLASLTRFAGLPWRKMGLFAIILSQSGEFVFVLLSLSRSLKVIPDEQTKILTAVVALSMFMTPLLLIAYERLVVPRLAKAHVEEEAPFEHPANSHDNPVIIAGFGRFGQVVARLLHANRIGTTVIDYNPDVITRVKQFGYESFYGDASREDLLIAAGIQRAKIFVIAIDDRNMAVQVARLLKRRFPHIDIVARAWDMPHCYEFLDLGINEVERETFHSALLLGTRVLNLLGFGRYQALRSASKFKAYDCEMLEKLYLVHKNQEEFISRAREAREEMQKIFNSDEEVLEEEEGHQKAWG